MSIICFKVFSSQRLRCKCDIWTGQCDLSLQWKLALFDTHFFTISFGLTLSGIENWRYLIPISSLFPLGWLYQALKIGVNWYPFLHYFLWGDFIMHWKLALFNTHFFTISFRLTLSCIENWRYLIPISSLFHLSWLYHALKIGVIWYPFLHYFLWVDFIMHWKLALFDTHFFTISFGLTLSCNFSIIITYIDVFTIFRYVSIEQMYK